MNILRNLFWPGNTYNKSAILGIQSFNKIYNTVLNTIDIEEITDWFGACEYIEFIIKNEKMRRVAMKIKTFISMFVAISTLVLIILYLSVEWTQYISIIYIISIIYFIKFIYISTNIFKKYDSITVEDFTKNMPVRAIASRVTIIVQDELGASDYIENIYKVSQQYLIRFVVSITIFVFYSCWSYCFG